MPSPSPAMVHMVREPRQRMAELPPLLLMLHGVGSNEQDLMPLAAGLDPRFCVVSARGPVSLGPGAYGWYHVQWTPEGPIGDAAEAEQSRLRLLLFRNELLTAYDLDPQRVYLLGFSQGAIMSLLLALTEPETMAGVVLMSGRLLPGGVTSLAEPARLAGLPVFVAHGTQDQVLPIREGRAIRDRLASLPVALEYREYPMRHEVTPQSLGDISRWLTAQLDARGSGSGS